MRERIKNMYLAELAKSPVDAKRRVVAQLEEEGFIWLDAAIRVCEVEAIVGSGKKIRKRKKR